MCIFFTIHTIFNHLKIDVDKDGNIEHGKRNCKLLLAGGLIYIILFTILKDRKVTTQNNRIDGLLSGLFYMFILDVATMGYTYKSYFGRSLLHELGGENDYKFNYNETTHKYTRKTPKIVTKIVREPSVEYLNANVRLLRQTMEECKRSKPNEIKRLFTGKTCTICLEEFDLDRDTLVSLPCGHVLHKECKDEIRNNSCPVCRAKY